MDRAVGAMLGLALVDALGMPSQTMSRDAIRRTYGRIADFVDAAAVQPVSAGLRAGTVTDDTEQSLLLADLLLRSPNRFDEEGWAEALLQWERGTKARGVNDLLGPSTKRALDALMRGVPASETGRQGATNGATMRVAPVGIAVPAGSVAALVDAVEATARITHNTGAAIGAAAAVASVVSAGVDGASFEAAIPGALAAAREGECRGHRASAPSVSAAPSVSDRIAEALRLAAAANGPQEADWIADRIGTGVSALESVPTAFAMVRLAAGDAWTAAVLSANLGGDTDTIGAIAASMAGACSGASALPKDRTAKVVSVNGLDLVPIVRGLLARRERRAAAELREAAE